MNRVVDVLDREAARHPDRACLIDGSGSLTYHEVYQRTLRIAQQLRGDGFAPGEHGAVLAPNDALGFVCALGLNRAGLVWLPVNARDSAEYIAAHLARFDADVLFLHSSFEHYVPTVTERAPSIRRIVIYDRDLDSWAGAAPTTDVVAPLDPAATAAIFATSGTTGVPKGVELSTQAFGYLIDALGTILAEDEQTVYLAAAPLTHVSGRICLTVMGLGGTTVVLERATPQAVLDALEQQAITLTFLPPTVIYALLTHPGIEDRKFPALRRLGYGSAPMRPDAIARALELFGPVLAQGYGQTEAPILISSLEREDHFVDGALAPLDRLTSAGRATPFTQIAILDDAGTSLPTGEVGEICVRGDYLMSRYY